MHTCPCLSFIMVISLFNRCFLHIGISNLQVISELHNFYNNLVFILYYKSSKTQFKYCRDRERKRKYRILLKIDLADVCPQLTKIVTFLPNFIVFNECKKPLRFMEENEKADLWIDLSPSQVNYSFVTKHISPYLQLKKNIYILFY